MRSERTNYILDKLRQDKKVKASDIVKKYNVTMETVRRDFEDLEKQGLLRHVYGGAKPIINHEPEPSYGSRMVTRLEEKKKMAKKACEIISENETIFIDGGTTMLEVAKELARKNLKLTIVTNSMPIASTLCNSTNIETIILGGKLSKDGDFVIASLLNTYDIEMFNFDKAIFGVASISKEQGVTDYSLEISALKRNIISRSKETMFIADNSKFNKRVKYTVHPYEKIDYLITDAKTDKEEIERCKELGIEVIVAD